MRGRNQGREEARQLLLFGWRPSSKWPQEYWLCQLAAIIIQPKWSILFDICQCNLVGEIGLCPCLSLFLLPCIWRVDAFQLHLVHWAEMERSSFPPEDTTGFVYLRPGAGWVKLSDTVGNCFSTLPCLHMSDYSYFSEVCIGLVSFQHEPCLWTTPSFASGAD